MTVNINGDLSQWTLGNTFAACVSGQILADGYRLHKAGTSAVHTVRRSTEVPAFDLCGWVIPYSLEVEVTTADASVGASDITAIVMRGEGSEWADLAGGVVRKRLWLKATLAGIYNLHLSNGPETLSYCQPILINFADTWTPFDVWCPRAPGNIGTDWWVDHRVGYTVALVLASGSGVQSEPETWQGSLKFGCPQVNFNATVTNKIKIAGLRVGDGPMMFQPHEITEMACQRYLQKSFERDVAPVDGASGGTGELTFPAQFAGASVQQSAPVRLSPMRKAPTISAYNPGTGTAGQARAFNAGACTGTTFDKKTATGFRAITTTPAGTTAGETVGVHWVADASLPALTQNVGT